eukprot:12064092-Alexandrium_andersonii.AAC.1
MSCPIRSSLSSSLSAVAPSSAGLPGSAPASLHRRHGAVDEGAPRCGGGQGCRCSGCGLGASQVPG